MTDVKMVDITIKNVVFREAEAVGSIRLRRETIERILKGQIEKGDPVTIAKITAIQAVKKTSELLPLCHPIKITNVDVNHEILGNDIKLRVKVKALEQTGVEMEALTGVALGLLSIWDTVKKYEKDEKGQYPDTIIMNIRVLKKVKK